MSLAYSIKDEGGLIKEVILYWSASDSQERSMELRQLRYAVAVADYLNFRQASRTLHVAQPSLSVQIKQLEEEIGVALFIRSKRHVEITRPGKVFLKTAREALAMLDRSVSSARRGRARRSGNASARLRRNCNVQYPSPVASGIEDPIADGDGRAERKSFVHPDAVAAIGRFRSGAWLLGRTA